jgi:hypothetical protein
MMIGMLAPRASATRNTGLRVLLPPGASSVRKGLVDAPVRNGAGRLGYN